MISAIVTTDTLQNGQNQLSNLDCLTQIQTNHLIM
jgi:hypothetical protein